MTAVRNYMWTGIIRPAFQEVADARLPPTPPNRHKLAYFYHRFGKIDLESLLRHELQQTFQRVAVVQARALGNLIPARGSAWAHPTLANSVIDHGTVKLPRCDGPDSIRHPNT